MSNGRQRPDGVTIIALWYLSSHEDARSAFTDRGGAP